MLNKVMTDLDFANTLANNKFPNSPTLLPIQDLIANGFTVVKGSQQFKTLCDQAKADFEAFKQSNIAKFNEIYGENQKSYRIVNLHCKIPNLANLFANMPLVTEISDFFMGDTVVYTSLYFERGSMQDIHRDIPFFCTSPEYLYMGAWCALEDVDANNGPLLVVRGGHKLPELDREHIKQEVIGSTAKVDPHSSDLWNKYQNELMAQYQQYGLEVEEVYAEKGDVILWHPNTPHGGKKNLDPARTRHSIVFHIIPPDIPVGLQDVFYKDRVLMPSEGKKSYRHFGTRRIINYNHVSFAHEKKFKLADLDFYNVDAKSNGLFMTIAKKIKVKLNVLKQR